MAIKRYIANADNTITNAFKSDLDSDNRATGSNMGESDILEVFSVYGQSSGSGTGYTSELSRVLIKFPVEKIIEDRNNSVIPSSGNVGFFVRLFNAKHGQTLPRNCTLKIAPISQSWEEGRGLDMEEYTDLTYDNIGSNWLMAGSASNWNNSAVADGGTSELPAGNVFGGVYHTSPKFEQTFDRGYEDLEVNITHLVENWIDGENDGEGGANGGTDYRKLNYGVGIYITSSQQAYTEKTIANVSYQNLTGAVFSHYTKKFFARDSEFFFKRPCIEARWNSETKDNIGNFFYSSSLAPAEENLNTLYLYNYVRGELRDIPDIGAEEKGEGKILLSLYSGSANNTAPSGSKLMFSKDAANTADGSWAAESGVVLNATGGAVNDTTGIYSCSFAITGATEIPLTTLFAVWHSGSHGSSGNANDTQYHTASITPVVLKASNTNLPTQNYVTKITNLKHAYYKEENARFRVHIREKNWNPNIYTKATSKAPTNIIEDAYYKVYRVSDNLTIINYGTGSTTTPQTKNANISGSYSRLSYDISGNYFDLDMKLLQPDYAYGIKFVYYLSGRFAEQPENFQFRVEES